jgi:hypothetical protein
LDKLHRVKDHASRTIVYPVYQLFPHRLELLYFDSVKAVHSSHNDFKNTIKEDMEKNGLLCPMVVDINNNLRNCKHRLKVLTKNKLADASLFYKARDERELSFLSKLNVVVWKLHQAKTPPTDFEFLFKPPMQNYTDKCLHLLKEGVIK